MYIDTVVISIIVVIVVVVGIPVLFVLLKVGWLLIKPRVIEHTGGRLGSVWTDTGPRYPSEPAATGEES